jgi:hypothetical protein
MTPEEREQASADAAMARARALDREYRKPTSEAAFDADVLSDWARYANKTKQAIEQPIEETINQWRNRMANHESDHPEGVHPPYRTGLPADKTTPRRSPEPDADGRWTRVSRERNVPIR